MTPESRENQDPITVVEEERDEPVRVCDELLEHLEGLTRKSLRVIGVLEQCLWKMFAV